MWDQTGIHSEESLIFVLTMASPFMAKVTVHSTSTNSAPISLLLSTSDMTSRLLDNSSYETSSEQWDLVGLAFEAEALQQGLQFSASDGR